MHRRKKDPDFVSEAGRPVVGDRQPRLPAEQGRVRKGRYSGIAGRTDSRRTWRTGYDDAAKHRFRSVDYRLMRFEEKRAEFGIK
ncbi:MAG: hypothetical protein M2R45_02369 [Verrucomicrobia subdivision 3 bacterium]|nr:hypothetical protein [Limisphaerales bacterium]MCS1414920.1 hypothetical protein [Limisphaerales bacterium]